MSHPPTAAPTTLNPDSALGRIILHFYGTTDLEQIAREDQLQESRLREKLDEASRIRTRARIKDQEHIRHTTKEFVLTSAYKAGALRVVGSGGRRLRGKVLR